MLMNRCGIEFNKATGTNVGYIAPELSKLPEDECLRTAATKCMLFMLRGVCHHWKQIVGYHFTGELLCIFVDNFIPYNCARLKKYCDLWKIASQKSYNIKSFFNTF